LYDLCDRFDWHTLSHLLESGRQRIDVSDFDTTIHALKQVPAFDRDVMDRLTIMGRHVHYIESLSITQRPVAIARLQHLLHFAMGVTEWIR
jgi:hypothetical protein